MANINPPLPAVQGKIIPHPIIGPEPSQIEYAEVPYSHTFNLQAGQSSCAFDIDLPWVVSITNGMNSLNSAIPILMGYATTKQGMLPPLAGGAPVQTTLLTRRCPWMCPYFNWMWLASITNARTEKFEGYTNGAFGGVASIYDRVRVTVTFVSRPYNVLSDSQLTVPPYNSDESNRWVEKLPKPTAEYISIKGSTYQFTEGTAPLASKSHRANVDIGLITVKVDLEWVWHDVPNNFLMNADGVATGVIAGMGCVNSAAVWGYPAGTLLCLPPDITPQEQPIRPTLIGLPDFGPPRAWDVRFRFKYWDPPLTIGATTRGHNVAIWPPTARFALIKSVNPVAGNTVYPTYDFTKFFRYRPDNLPANP